jgi:hypothetical protein
MDFSTPRWPVPFRLLSGTAGKEVRKDDVILSSYCGKSVQFNHSGEPEFRFRIGSNPLGRLWGDIF